MNAVITNIDGEELGRIELQEGLAVPTTEEVQQLIRSVTVLQPGDPGRVLTPVDGEAYIRALAEEFRGGYVNVTLCES